jgi:segregation and condensation protein B
VSKRKKTSPAVSPAVEATEEHETDTTQSAAPPEVVERAVSDEGSPLGDEPPLEAPAYEQAAHVDDEMAPDSISFDAEATVNLSGELPLPGRDDLDEPTVAASSDELGDLDGLLVQRKHLRGLLEALVFASDTPIKANELAKLASAPLKLVKELLGELKQDFSVRGVHLDEVAGGWVFRTSAQYAPFIRDLTKQKPVRLTRAQVETLAIIAYRQPITRPEVDDVRGVDSGPVLKLLLERDLVRILGKRDEPGRPLIYGTTNTFLEFFGLKSLKDLPTLREFTELSDESRQAFEDELGEPPNDAPLPSSDDSPTATQVPTMDEEANENAPRESMRVTIADEDAHAAPSDEEQASEEHEADRDGTTLASKAAPGDDDDIVDVDIEPA